MRSARSDPKRGQESNQHFDRKFDNLIYFLIHSLNQRGLCARQGENHVFIFLATREIRHQTAFAI